MHADPTYPLLPVFAFLGFVVALIPLPWHFQASNAGTCVYMIWTSLACLVQFVNSIMWRDTALDLAPVWCDICKFSNHVCLVSSAAHCDFSSDKIHHRSGNWHPRFNIVY